MVFINLNNEVQTPLFQQVVTQIKEKIDNRILQPGFRLPSTRSLADKLGVNRTTIYKAYQELWALGYIESRSGSYSFVRQRREIRKSKDEPIKKIIDWDSRINESAARVCNIFGDINYPFSEKRVKFDGIDFARLHPDTRLYPLSKFKACLSKVINEQGEEILDYGDTLGYYPLRKFIAHRQQLHGIQTNADEVIITNGAQNAIDLVMKLLAKSGSRVFVESPTYGMIIPTLKYYNCEIVSIPMKDDGVDIDRIEKEFENGLPIFLYTMPNFQNPTGITSTQAHREKLLALFEKHQIPIIEDAFEEEMKYFGKVPLPIKSMDTGGIVIYIGSFSKVLFPGIRKGWITGDTGCIRKLAAIKRFSDLATALPEQAAVAEFCRQGHYELHIKKIHKIYRRRMMVAVNALSNGIKNKNVIWNEPNGGYTIWMRLTNTDKSYNEINNILLEHKVRFALGKDFFPDSANGVYLRLAIASLDEEEIIEGINRFSEALKEIYNN